MLLLNLFCYYVLRYYKIIKSILKHQLIFTNNLPVSAAAWTVSESTASRRQAAVTTGTGPASAVGPAPPSVLRAGGLLLPPLPAPPRAGASPGGQLALLEPLGDLARGQPSPAEAGGLAGEALLFMKS